MTLFTQRLLLVPLGPKYLMSTHQYSSDPDNARYMVHLPNTTMQETESFLQSVQTEWEKSKPDFYEFAILLGEEHIGAVSIYIDVENSEGELGWIIRKDRWGKGYALPLHRENSCVIISTQDELIDYERKNPWNSLSSWI